MRRRGYSMRALFVVAFLGGPLPAVLFGALNARQWNRLDRDLSFLCGLAVLSVALGFALGFQTVIDSRNGVRFVVRAAALALAGVLWLRHKALYKSQYLSELPVESPWLMGIVCTVVGGAITVGAGVLGKALK